MKKRLLRWVILLSIGFGIGMAIKHYKAQDKSEIMSISPDNEATQGK